MPRPPPSVPLRPAYWQAIDGEGAVGETDALSKAEASCTPPAPEEAPATGTHASPREHQRAGMRGEWR